MIAPTFGVGAYVLGSPMSPRALVRHADLLAAYADGLMAERDGTGEAYLSHFAFGSEMREHYARNRNSVAEYAGACWCRWLVLDIDRADPVEALADARKLVSELYRRYPEVSGDVPVYFSGRKGFHVLVELAHNPPPAVGFHRVARAFAEALAARAGAAIDTSVYDVAHIIRLPNTRHPKTGLFKRRIDPDALFALDVAAILEHAKHPAGDGMPTVGTPPAVLAGDWAEAERVAARAVQARTAIRRDLGTPDASAPRYFVEFLRFGVDEGERHPTLFRCAAWLTEQGAPPLARLRPAHRARARRGAYPEGRRAADPVRRRARPPTAGGCYRPGPGRRGAPGDRARGRPTDGGRDVVPVRGARPRRGRGGAGVTPNFSTGSDLLASWLADVERGEAPPRFRLPAPFAALDVRPGRLILFGGAPGGGKTAALLQVGIDLLRLNETARLLVANVEMATPMLLERVVSRLSAVPLTAIGDRTLTPEQLERVRAATAALRPVADRLAFLRAPFALEHVAAAGTAFGSNVMIIDYVQRFMVGDAGKDKREQLETAATSLRGFCDAGAAVLVASAVARQKGQGGSTYSGLNLASFRGSSELEYGCDAAYLHEPGEGGLLTLKCEKNRYGALADVVTSFDPVTQTFTPAPSGIESFDSTTPARSKGGKAKGD